MAISKFVHFHAKGIVERQPIAGTPQIVGGDRWTRVQVRFGDESRTVVGYGDLADNMAKLSVGREVCVSGVEPAETQTWRRRRDGKICSSKDIRADSIHVGVGTPSV